MNTFIALNNPLINNFIERRIQNGEYIKANNKYKYGERSKCIIKVESIVSMGIHKVILSNKDDDSFTNNILDYDDAEMLHVCNFHNRKNISVSRGEFMFNS